MALPRRRPVVIDISDSSDDDRNVPLGGLMTPEELLNSIPDGQLTPEHDTPQPAPTLTISSYDRCLQKVLEVFPDASHDYIKNLHDRHPPNTPSPDGIPIFEEIISAMLDHGNYPKERDRQNELKRKRADSDGQRAAQWASHNNLSRPPDYEHGAVDALVDDFPDMPRKFIELKFREIGNLYAVYLALDIADDTFDTSAPRPYTRLKRARKSRPSLSAASSAMSPTGYGLTELQKELEAARAQRKKLQTQRQVKKDAIAAEAAEEQELIDNKQVLECGSCFEDYPINKITFCNGDEPHSACFDCVTQWVKTKIGESRYQLPCTVESDCKATYSRRERIRFLDPQLIERLERLEQQTCLREANLPNLEECPFCDFAAECPPIEVDKEFRCGNTECQKVSCRKCKVATHIPMSCEEFKKENGLTERHQIEEARTQALLRSCPKCKKTIMKEGGCNKMTCSCGAYICDYCGKDITSQLYGHFSDSPTSFRIPGIKKCPTYDNDYTRNKENMDKAEKEAVEKVRKENPGISEEDLKIKMKKSVESPKRRPRGLAHAGLPPEALAAYVAARRQQAMYMHMGVPPGYPAMPVGVPHDLQIPPYVGPHGVPPPGVPPPAPLPAAFNAAHPLNGHGPHNQHGHGPHVQPAGYVPAPRYMPRRAAIADQGGQRQRMAQAGGHHPHFHHGGNDYLLGFDGDDDIDFGMDEDLDDMMAELGALRDPIDAYEVPRRRRH
ncbi:MAG: hypothetical protein Q9169_001167 [Polycauliona sp. 2 TL-2023]